MTPVATLRSPQVCESSNTYDALHDYSRKLAPPTNTTDIKYKIQKSKKMRGKKSNINQLCGWLISINGKCQKNPARYCILGRIGSITYDNVKNLLKTPNLSEEDYIQLLEDIAMVTISPKRALIFFNTLEDAFLPDSNVLEIINVDRIECTLLSTRSFAITTNEGDSCFLVEHPQSACEWVSKIEQIKKEPSDVLDEEKKNQISNILKKIRFSEAAAAKIRTKNKIKHVRGSNCESKKECHKSQTANSKSENIECSVIKKTNGVQCEKNEVTRESGARNETPRKSMGVIQKFLVKFKGSQQEAPCSASEKNVSAKIINASAKGSAEKSADSISSTGTQQSHVNNNKNEENMSGNRKYALLSTLVFKDNVTSSELQPTRHEDPKSDKVEPAYTLKPLNIKKGRMSDTKRHSYMVDLGNIKEFPFNEEMPKKSQVISVKTLSRSSNSLKQAPEIASNPSVDNFEQSSVDKRDSQEKTKIINQDKQNKCGDSITGDIKAQVLHDLSQNVKQVDPFKGRREASSSASWDESLLRDLTKNVDQRIHQNISDTRSTTCTGKVEEVSINEIGSELPPDAELTESDSSNEECLKLLKKYAESKCEMLGTHDVNPPAFSIDAQNELPTDNNSISTALVSPKIPPNTPTKTLGMKYKPFLGMRHNVIRHTREVDVDEEEVSVETTSAIIQPKPSKWRVVKMFSTKSIKNTNTNCSNDYKENDKNVANSKVVIAESQKTSNSFQALKLRKTKKVCPDHNNVSVNSRDNKTGSPGKALKVRRKEFLYTIGNLFVMWRTLQNSNHIRNKRPAKVVEKKRDVVIDTKPSQGNNLTDTNSEQSSSGGVISSKEVYSQTIKTSPKPEIDAHKIEISHLTPPISGKAEPATLSPKSDSDSHRFKTSRVIQKQSKNTIFGLSTRAINLKSPLLGKLMGTKSSKSVKLAPVKAKVTREQSRSRKKSRKTQVNIKEASNQKINNDEIV